MTTAAPENRATREDGSFADKQTHAEQLARLSKNQGTLTVYKPSPFCVVSSFDAPLRPQNSKKSLASKR